MIFVILFINYSKYIPSEVKRCQICMETKGKYMEPSVKKH